MKSPRIPAINRLHPLRTSVRVLEPSVGTELHFFYSYCFVLVCMPTFEVQMEAYLLQTLELALQLLLLYLLPRQWWGFLFMHTLIIWCYTTMPLAESTVWIMFILLLNFWKKLSLVTGEVSVLLVCLICGYFLSDIPLVIDSEVAVISYTLLLIITTLCGSVSLYYTHTHTHTCSTHPLTADA